MDLEGADEMGKVSLKTSRDKGIVIDNAVRAL
jgi:hypothetical protein